MTTLEFRHSSQDEGNEFAVPHYETKIEIATLEIPVEANEGIQSGDGAKFILEMPGHVIDQVDSVNINPIGQQLANTTEQIQYDNPQNGYYGSSSHPSQTTHRRQASAYIEGVVNLEVVSELVTGVTEEEFVDILQQDFLAQQAAVATQTLQTAQDQPATSGTTISEDPPFVAEPIGIILDNNEKQPLISTEETNQDTSNAVSIVVSADPFVESIANVHAAHAAPLPLDPPFHRSHHTPTPSLSQEEVMEIVVSTIDAPENNDDPNEEEHKKVAKEAFLLSIPTLITTDPAADSIAENKPTYHRRNISQQDVLESTTFVLALPEIKMEESANAAVTSSSDNANVDNHRHSTTEPEDPLDSEGFVQMLDRNIFNKSLPTDVQHIELRISTTIAPPGGTTEHELRSSYNSYKPPKHHVDTPLEQEFVHHLDVVVQRQVPLIAYLILISGLLALSSTGAAMDLQLGGVHPLMKTLWRSTSSALVLLPLAMLSLRRNTKDSDEDDLTMNNTNANFVHRMDDLRASTGNSSYGDYGNESIVPYHRCAPALTWTEAFLFLPIASIMCTIMMASFVIALEMTSLANCFILTNMASLVLIASKLITGVPVLLLEGAGAIVGFIGALLCASATSSVEPNEITEDEYVLYDSPLTTPQSETVATSSSSSHGMNEEILGNLIAFSGSIATAIYLYLAQRLRPKMDLFLFMFLNFGLGSLFLFLFMYLSNIQLELSFHPIIGIFGWLDMTRLDRLPLELYLAVICNGIGNTGFIAIMKYFDPVVISMVMLMEPVIAALMGVAMGVSEMPGTITWIGDAIVTMGSIMVIWSGSKKTESFDATEALLPTSEYPASGAIAGEKGGVTKSPIPSKKPIIPMSSTLPVDKRKHVRKMSDRGSRGMSLTSEDGVFHRVIWE